ncbi:ion transporter [Siccibacter colletis]|uniref:ion transporter n=1 Tax=Siccibacter colletis TaxID=1505757 RepID=UPI003CE73848
MMPALFSRFTVSGITLRRRHLFHLLFDQRIRSARRVEAFCGLMALLSVIVVFFESSIMTRHDAAPPHPGIWLSIEVAFTLFFTLEYLLRLILAARPARYVFSFWGILDLATLLPLYVYWLWPEIAVSYLFIWRAMRAVRALRILKLLRYMPSLRLVGEAVSNARHQLILFYAFIAIVMVVAGALMYGIEGGENGFDSLGASVYWAVVTVTTVGYGDLTPHTSAGRVVASLLILIGYSVIAIPTGILSSQMTESLQRRRLARVCRRCHCGDHKLDALFCHHCGAALPQMKR